MGRRVCPEWNLPRSKVESRKEGNVIKTRRKKGIRFVGFLLVLMLAFLVAPTAKAATTGKITVRNARDRTLMYMKALDFAQGNVQGKGSYSVPADLKEGYKSFLKKNAAAFSLNASQIDGFSDAALNNAVQQLFSDTTKFTEAKRREFAEHIAAIGETKGLLQPMSLPARGSRAIRVAENLPLGYYIIVDKTSQPSGKTGWSRSLVMLTTTDPNATIKLKTQETGNSKYVYNPRTKWWTGEREAQPYDTVDFRYVAELPSEMSAYKRFTLDFTDKMPKGLILTENPTQGGL